MSEEMKPYQTVILVDDKDEVLGYASKDECHTGRGKRHRAFVTLLFNDKDEVLLQKRKHRIFDSFWDLTAISHPLHINGRDENYQEASDRALKKEMGIGHVPVQKVGAFNYFARDGKNCENEYCAILTGEFSGKFKPESREVYEAKWVKYSDFMADVAKNPTKFTPWVLEAAKVFKSVKPNEFLIELETFYREFAKFYKTYFAKKQKLVEKYPSLISRFYKELEEFGAGGKAMRPFLVYLGYRSAGGLQISKILPVCLAVELVHSFLLIHDDIIDNSDMRRAKPTVHKKLGQGNGHYGVSQAIVIADVAAFEAIRILNQSDFSSQTKAEVLDLLTGVILETAYGEILDIEYAYKKASIDKVWLVTELKTAKYSFVGPLKLGAFLAGAKASQLGALEQYGIRLGRAFQIQDDILGVFGNEKILGKSTLSDMREGKNTLLFYKTCEMANAHQARILERVWGNKNAAKSDLLKVKKIMEESGGLKWSRKEMGKLARDANSYIAAVTNDKKLATIFTECADFVINRQK